MYKILLRFIIICFLISIFVSFAVTQIYHQLNDRITSHYVQLNAETKYSILLHYLSQFPSATWSTHIQQIQPNGASDIHLIEIDDLDLNEKLLNEIKNGKLVYINSNDKYHPAVIYKKIPNSKYIIQEFYNFRTAEQMQRFVSWYPVLIKLSLASLPKNEWNSFLTPLSIQHGMPLKIFQMKDLPFSTIQKHSLLKNGWLYIADSQTETVYFMLGQTDILKIGPVYFIRFDKYEEFFIYFGGFILVEFFITIMALLFFISLNKLNKLANVYGQGNFDSTISLGRSSSLYPLFHNLKIMGARIKSLIHTQKELTQIISHELKTPLSRCQFSLALLKNSLKNNVDLSHVESLQEDLKEIDELINEILIYSRLTTIAHIEFKKINLKEMIDTIINKFPTAKHFNNKVDQHFQIMADEKYLRRALMNILANAYRFSKNTICIDAVHHCIVIEDDGPGIPSADSLRIFEPFIQLSSSSEQKHSGLGLAIVKKIIEQHRWTISVEKSKLGGAKIIINTNPK